MNDEQIKLSSKLGKKLEKTIRKFLKNEGIANKEENGFAQYIFNVIAFPMQLIMIDMINNFVQDQYPQQKIDLLDQVYKESKLMLIELIKNTKTDL